MKTKLTVAIIAVSVIALCSSPKTNAQNTSPYWSLAGNSNATTSSKLGTTNSMPLRLLTNNLVRLYIAPTTGNVGIGMGAAAGTAYKLRVQGVQYGTYSSGSIYGVYGSGTSIALYGSGGTYGVFGRGTTYGVSGNGGPYGVYGLGTSYGVYGTSSTSYGVYGKGGTHGVHVQGTIYGVSGNGGTYGIFGTGITYGVYGTGNYYGVYGTSTIGVFGAGTTYGVSGSGGTYGVSGSGGTYGVSGSGGTYGIYGTSDNIGVYGTGNYIAVFGISNSENGNGVEGISNTKNGSGVGVKGGGGYGVDGRGTYIGVRGDSQSGYGVYGISVNGIGGSFLSENTYGLTAAGGTYAGVFSGAILATVYVTSDKNLKKNIKGFEDAMSIINKLQPKDYEFRTDEKFASLHLPKGTHYGLIAQDIEEVLPNLVKEAPQELITKTKAMKPALEDRKEPAPGNLQEEVKQETATKETMKIKAVNYIELIPIMIKAMQEQQSTIEKQQQQIDELKQLVTKLTSASQSSLNLIGAYLKQNAPNPFSKNTTIECYVPSSVTHAQLVIYDIDGRQLQSFTLNNSGINEVTINAGTLSSGQYIYSFVVDGKKVDSKNMIITK